MRFAAVRDSVPGATRTRANAATCPLPVEANIVTVSEASRFDPKLYSNANGDDDVTNLVESALRIRGLGRGYWGAASAEEYSGSITAEEVLRAEDTRYAAQI